MDHNFEGTGTSIVEILPSTSAHIDTLTHLLNTPVSAFPSSEKPYDVLYKISEAQQRFRPLQKAVDERYTSTNSLIYDKPALRESFKAHNEEVLASAVIMSSLLGVDETQRRIIEAAAITHDIAKADRVPTEIPLQLQSDYILLRHPELGAEVAKQLLSKTPFQDKTTQDSVHFAEEVAQTIQSHSGPIPGFMQERLDYYNEHAENALHINTAHPQHIPSVVLLAADMLGLGTPTGVNKIVEIRQKSPHFTTIDQKSAVEQKISIHEVRINSALTSAYQGAAMVKGIMIQNPQLSRHAEALHSLMIRYFAQTKSQLISSAP